MSERTHEIFLEEHKKIVELENLAHDLIVEMCESKSIKLELKQEGRTGHCEIAEIWAFEKPIPLTKKDLSQIKKFPNLYLKRETGTDETIYAVEFVRGGGWCVYELDKHDDSKYFKK